MTVTDWHNVPELREELKLLMEKTVLSSALNLLSLKAKARPLTLGADVTALALTHAHLAGYQKALDDFAALAQPPQRAPGLRKSDDPLAGEWGYVQPSQ
jgi:hypothetical protein